jgi:hypothetical protein
MWFAIAVFGLAGVLMIGAGLGGGVPMREMVVGIGSALLGLSAVAAIVLASGF